MSADAHMSCERCQDLLTELVCDELSAVDAAAVRAHAKGCPRCGPALQKFERTLEVSLALPLLAPSPDVEKRIMQAARGALQNRAKGPLRELPEAPRSGFLAWCARIGSWAMSPQVAMASVLLLVVGIGLYALPLGAPEESAGLRASEEPSAAPMAPEPAAAASAAPTPEKVMADEHEGAAAAVPARELLEESKREARSSGAKEPAKKGGDALEYEARKLAPGKPKAAPATVRRSADDQSAALGELGRANAESSRLKEAEAPADKRASAPKQDRFAEADYATGNRFAPPPPAAAAPATAAQAGPRGEGGSMQAQSAQSQAMEARAQSTQRAAGKAATSEDTAQSASGLGQGIAAAQRGDLATAQKLLTPIAQQGAQPERAQASLWLARTLRAAGDCARALTYYKPLAESAGASRAVLDEAADCYERTGGAMQAKRLRARAVPGAAPATKAE